MAIKPVLKMGHPLLRQQAAAVTEFNTDELHQLIADLFDTMRATGGVGIAAPQIGVSLQVVIFGFERSDRYPHAEPVPETVLINPILTPLGTEREAGWEGCLSVPGLRGNVERYRQLHYSGQDAYGQQIDRQVSGFHARVVQHEVDHLLGILYPQRLHDLSLFGFNDSLFPELPAETAG